MTIDSETVGPAAVILLAARGADDPHHAGTIALLRTGALAALDVALYEITTSPISDAGTPGASLSLHQRTGAKRSRLCRGPLTTRAATQLSWPH
jgi:hypothetical protein